MTTLLQDMRYGLRVLWKSPGFTIVACFPWLWAWRTRRFLHRERGFVAFVSFSHPDRLVKVVARNRGAGTRDIGFSVPELDDLRTRAGVFEQVAAMLSGGTNLTGAEHPQRLEIAAVSANYFSMLGTSAHIGRVFGPGDEVPGYGEAIAISDSLWARGFGRLRLGVASSYPFRNERTKLSRIRHPLGVWHCCATRAVRIDTTPTILEGCWSHFGAGWLSASH